jgi:WD40 repeat protein
LNTGRCRVTGQADTAKTDAFRKNLREKRRRNSMKKLISVIPVLMCLAAALLSAQDVEIYPQMGPQGSINSIKFSPDGKWILANVGIWDAATGRELKRPYSGNIMGWSPDMKRYLTSTRVRDWETDTAGATIRNIRAETAVFSPDGKQIAAITSDSKNIKTRDSLNGQELLTINGPENGINSFRYSADGKAILFRSFVTVSVFDLVQKRQLRSFSANVADGKFQEAIFSPDGKLFIMATTTGGYNTGYRGFVKIYDTTTGRELRTLSGHTSFVTALACSPDGKQIISADRDNIMKIWDAQTGRELRSTKMDDYIENVEYSPDSKRLVYSTGIYDIIRVLDAGTYRELITIKPLYKSEVLYINDTNRIIIRADTPKTIAQWDMGTGRRLWTIDIFSPFTRVFPSPNGRYFITIGPTSNENAGMSDINLFDMASGKLIRTWQNGRNIDTMEIFWYPDSRRITAFSYYYYVENLCRFDIWDIETRQRISSFEHTKPAPLSKSVQDSLVNWSFSPDGRRFFYRFVDSVQIWAADSNKKILTISGTLRLTWWSPDGRRILFLSSDTVRVWDAETGREILNTIKHDGLKDAAYSPDGRQIITGGKSGVIFWNAETGAKIRESNVYGTVSAIEISADGKKILANSDNFVTVIDGLNGNGLGTLAGFQKNVISASFSADGKWIITGDRSGTVRIYSAESFVEKARFIAYEDGEWLAMTPDGYYNASANGGKYVNARVGNTVTGIDRYRSTFNKPAVVAARLSNPARMTHNDAVNSVAVNPGGTRIASVSHDRSIKLWDLESGKLLRTITNTGGYANAISFSPDGRRLVHGAEDKTVRIWDAETGAALRTITGHTGYVNEARYSPDGKRIASCADDKLIKIWDAETGREIRNLAGHTDLVTVVAWSPDGRRIATGSDATEKTIRIWDAESGRVLQTITGQGGRILALAYSPDGKKIASSALEDKAVKIWDAETGRLIRSIAVEDNGGVYSLAWSPDGKRLASGAVYGGEEDYGNHIAIWNAETGEPIMTIWEDGTIFSLAFTPDGRRIVAGCTFSDARFIKVFDALTGKEL